MGSYARSISTIRVSDNSLYSLYVIYNVEIKSYLRLVNILSRFDEDLYSFISIRKRISIDLRFNLVLRRRVLGTGSRGSKGSRGPRPRY